MKKVRCFYLYGKDILTGKYKGCTKEYTSMTEDGILVNLYAYTADKEIAKNFMKLRNMNIFLYKEIKMEEEEYDDFNTEFPKAIIEAHAMCTKNIHIVEGNTEETFTRQLVTVYCTSAEVDPILYDKECIFADIMTKCIEKNEYMEKYPKLFKGKLAKALNEVFGFNYMIEMIYPYEEVPFGDVEYDELAFYCSLYKNTFKDR